MWVVTEKQPECGAETWRIGFATSDEAVEAVIKAHQTSWAEQEMDGDAPGLAIAPMDAGLLVAFTEPSISLDETIERYADHLMKVEHMAHLQARDQAELVIASLKRWDHGGMHQRIAS